MKKETAQNTAFRASKTGNDIFLRKDLKNSWKAARYFTKAIREPVNGCGCLSNFKAGLIGAKRCKQIRVLFRVKEGKERLPDFLEKILSGYIPVIGEVLNSSLAVLILFNLLR